MPGGWVLLQMVQYSPTQHVGKKYVEGDSCWVELPRQGQCIDAATRDQDLEALVARKVAENPRIMQVILHNKQNTIIGLQRMPVVFNLLGVQLNHGCGRHGEQKRG